MLEDTLWVPVSASLVTPPWSEFFFELTFKLTTYSRELPIAILRFRAEARR